MGTYPSRSSGPAVMSGSVSVPSTMVGSWRSSRAAPRLYVRIGPTPWVMTTHPWDVSSGDEHGPSWMSSQGWVGRSTVTGCPQRSASAEVVTLMDSRSQRETVEAAGDPPWEEGHALVLRCGTELGSHREGLEVCGAQQVRRDAGSVVRRVRGVVPDAVILVDESHQASVLDAVALCLSAREDHRSDRSLVLAKVSS